MSVDWLLRAVPQASGLYPYVPGKPVAQLLREKGLTEAIKLASNENPYGPSPKAIAAMKKAAAEVHRYPDGNATALKAALAARHQVETDQILPGNGSNEVLEILIRSFAGSGDKVVFSQRGFIVYALVAQAAGAMPVPVPEADGLSHDLDAMAAAVNEQTRIVCLANPNNPTGSMHGPAAIQTFLDALPRDVVVIIDEAYYEYVADELGDSWHTLRHPGLVISRTFSKAYGLAGCRIGYAIADAGIVSVANRFREPFNVSLLALEAATAALEDQEWVMEKVACCKAERTLLETGLDALGVKGGTSYGNFVLLQHPQAAQVLHKLEDQGIIPRPLAPYGMPDFLRISVGTEAENRRLLSALSGIIPSLA